jgi:hypothetical protein
VRETEEALSSGTARVIDSVTFRIVHSLFVNSSDVAAADVREVRSHEQALAQCKASLMRIVPQAKLVPIEDTALGAARLAKGEYSNAVAVISSRDAGAEYGLFMLHDAVQDQPDNNTTFSLVQAKIRRRPSLKQTISRLAIRAVTKENIDKATKGFVILTILAGIFARDLLGYSSWKAATTIGGFASVIFLLLTSRKFEQYLLLRAIKGYWRYHVTPDEKKPLLAQEHETPRVVCIRMGDSDIEIRGWLASKPPRALFKSTEVVTSPFGRREGRLVYRYRHVDDASTKSFLDGVVSLTWDAERPASRVNRLSGWYVGRLTADVGILTYERITKQEFDAAVGSVAEGF